MRTHGGPETKQTIARLPYLAIALGGIAGLFAAFAAIPLTIPSDTLNVNTATAEEIAVALEIEPEVADRLISEREAIGGFASVSGFGRTPAIAPDKARNALSVLSRPDAHKLTAEELAPALGLPRVLGRRIVADRLSRPGGQWRTPADALSAPALDPAILAANLDRLVVRTPGAAIGMSLLWLALGLGSLAAACWAQRKLLDGADPWFPALAAVPSGVMLAVALGVGDPLRDALTISHTAAGLMLSCVAYLVTAWLSDRKTKPDTTRGTGWIVRVAAWPCAWLAACLAFNRGQALGAPGIVYIAPLIFGGSLAAALRHLGGVSPDRTRRPRIRRDTSADGRLGMVGLACTIVAVVAVAVGSRSLGMTAVTGLACAAMLFVIDLRLWSGLAAALTGLIVWAATGLDGAATEAARAWLYPWAAKTGVSSPAQALWSLASGGPFGSGLGLGDPPTPHGPLALAAVGEELGTPGILLMLLALTGLVWRAAGAAVRGCSDRDRLIAAAFASTLAAQTVLSAFGGLDLLPMLDIHVPFASDSRMLQAGWFAALGVLAGMSATQAGVAVGADRRVFRMRIGQLAAATAILLLGIAVARSAWLQTFAADAIASHPVRVQSSRGEVRIIWNPRLSALARTVERGTIFDGFDRILATSRLREIHATLPDEPQLARRYYRAGRYYPYGAVCAGVVGLWTRLDGAHGGVEAQLDAHLRGYRRLSDLLPLYRSKDLPRPLRPGPVRGADVVLGINAVLQEDAYRILNKAVAETTKRSGRRAALVVLNAVNGTPTVSAGVPCIDPNVILLRRSNPVGPGLEVQGLVDHARTLMPAPPGPFKIATALALGDAGRQFETDCGHDITGLAWDDAGTQRTVDLISDDAMDRPHGRIGMKRALKLSCNVWFARLAANLGADEVYARMAALLGKPVLPRRDEFGRQLPDIATGTGSVWMSALDMAAVAARATTAMSQVRPMYWRELRFTDGRGPVPAPVAVEVSPDAPIAPETAETIRAALIEAVEEGPASAVFDGLRVRVAGKSASVPSGRTSDNSDAWFVGFAPVSRPQFAIACWIEGGGSGLRSAAPVVRDMLREMSGP